MGEHQRKIAEERQAAEMAAAVDEAIKLREREEEESRCKELNASKLSMDAKTIQKHVEISQAIGLVEASAEKTAESNRLENEQITTIEQSALSKSRHDLTKDIATVETQQALEE